VLPEPHGGEHGAVVLLPKVYSFTPTTVIVWAIKEVAWCGVCCWLLH